MSKTPVTQPAAGAAKARSMPACRRPGTAPCPPAYADPTVRILARLFRQRPAWVAAADGVDRRAESTVFFTHMPGRPWRLVRSRGKTLLLPGRARDPDFVFRFTPQAVARLAAVRGGVGDFAAELFARIAEPRRAGRVDVRVVAPFTRLVERGYVRLLLDAGPRVMAFALARGVTTIGQLRSLVERARQRRPPRWEQVPTPRASARSARPS